MGKLPQLARRADRDAVTGFLRANLPVAFYPLSNLTDYGMGMGHAKAMRFWIWQREGAITDALGVTGRGFLFPVFTRDVAASAGLVLAGQVTRGLAGLPAQVAALRPYLRILATPRLDFEEPVYRLALDNLQMPDCSGLALAPVMMADVSLLAGWRKQFLVETQGLDPDNALQRAVSDMDEIAGRDLYRVLTRDGVPVAMTGFNGRMDEVVQVGGVFVPPSLRGCGFGRAAVALHLSQARADGVRMAYLNAANGSAGRAYMALGFQRCGGYAAVVYEGDQIIGQ